MPPEPQSVTQLLHQSRTGDKAAFDQLLPVIYEQLHKLAARCFRSESPGQTLCTTALVHEAYIRLVDAEVAWKDRVHFYAVAARVMRRILVDHAKAQHREKRGGDLKKISLDEGLEVGSEAPPQLLDLDEALDRLASRDERKSAIGELIFFGGLTYDEAAAALDISSATLHRDLRMAKAWLYNELAHGASEGAQL